MNYQYTRDPRVSTLKVIYSSSKPEFFKTVLILSKQFINGVQSAGDPSPNFVSYEKQESLNGSFEK